MAFSIKGGHVLLGISAVIAPLAAGCGTPPAMEAMGSLATPTSGPMAGNNARSSFYVTDGGTENSQAVTIGKAKANITQGEAMLSLRYTVASDAIHDMNGVGQINNVYPTGSGTISQQVLPDIDGNGQQDTFLIVTKNNPVSAARTERSAAYTGPFTDKAQMEALRTNSAKATYTGSAGIVGTMGNTPVSQTGSLNMTADFAAATISGEMKLSPNAVPTSAVYDNVTFSGRLTQDLNEFAIEKATIRNGTTAITNDSATGVGSFVGTDARGTIGTFAKSSPIIGTGDNANVLGTFYGSKN